MKSCFKKKKCFKKRDFVYFETKNEFSCFFNQQKQKSMLKTIRDHFIIFNFEETFVFRTFTAKAVSYCFLSYESQW